MLLNHHYTCHFSSKINFYIHNPPVHVLLSILRNVNLYLSWCLIGIYHISCHFWRIILRKTWAKCLQILRENIFHLAISHDWKRGHMTCPISAVSQLFAKALFPAFRVIMPLDLCTFQAFRVQRVTLIWPYHNMLGYGVNVNSEYSPHVYYPLI